MADEKMLPVVSQQNQPMGEITLPAEVCGGPVRRHLLHEVVRMQLANRRAGTHATKTRGFVSGGGKKPWKQKGTGRARAGSIRSPLWPGGAVIFGPQPRDYSYRIPASARRSALRSAFTAKVRDGQVMVVDKIELEAPKTKFLVEVLAALNTDSALILIPDADLALERAARNLPRTKVLRVAGANVYDLLRYRQVIVLRDAISALQRRMQA